MIAGIFVIALAAVQAKPFNGKDLHGWEVIKKAKAKSQWKVGVAKVDSKDPKKLKAAKGKGELVNQGKGVDLKTISELLGHSTTTMTERYSHLSPKHKTLAVNLLSSDLEWPTKVVLE